MKKLFVVLAVLALVGGSAFAQVSNSASVSVNVAVAVTITPATSDLGTICMISGTDNDVFTETTNYFDFTIYGQSTATFSWSLAFSTTGTVTFNDAEYGYSNVSFAATMPLSGTSSGSGSISGSLPSTGNAYLRANCDVDGAPGATGTVVCTATLTGYSI